MLLLRQTAQAARRGHAASGMLSCLQAQARIDSRANGSHAESELFQADTESFGRYNPEVRRSLQEMNISQMNEAQLKSIRLIEERKNVLLSAITGSGKTLSFLLPAVQRAINTQFEPFDTLILVPTRELATQVYGVGHKLLKHVPGIKAGSKIHCLAKGMDKEQRQPRRLRREMPSIIVATPKRALEMLDLEPSFSGFKTIVIDEADKLLDALKTHASLRQKKNRAKHPKPTSLVVDRLVFGHAVEADTDREQLQRNDVQIVCTSATLGRSVKGELYAHGWADEYVTLNVHGASNQLPPSLSHYMLYQSLAAPEMDGFNAQHQLLSMVDRSLEIFKPCTSLVFVPTSVPVNEVVSMLRAQFHDADRTATVCSIYEAVHQKAPSQADVSLGELVKLFANATQDHPVVGVINMDTARGLDIPGVELAVAVGTPRDHREYLHMSGRVARAGKQGKIVTIAYDEQQQTRIKGMASLLKIDLTTVN